MEKGRIVSVLPIRRISGVKKRKQTALRTRLKTRAVKKAVDNSLSAVSFSPFPR